MIRHLVAALIGLAAAATATPAGAQDHGTVAADTKAEVPALMALHDVIYPLWHQAWPAKDVAMIKELLPQVQQHVAAIEKADLPGILRDKRPEWARQVKALRATVTAYEKAAAANETQPMLDAVEALHTRFEQMTRLIRPVMKELDAYHQVLYVVYHELMPAKRLAEMPAAAAGLSTACATLAGAAVPARFAAQEVELKAATVKLCTVTEALKAVAATGDAEKVAAAVERVHTQYLATEKLFN
jgi:hypothetical protein